MSELSKVSPGMPIKPLSKARGKRAKDDGRSARRDREKGPDGRSDRPEGHIDRYV